ncbi:MAG TPA: 8-amino-7-oxononanoate synthase [Pseudomonadales bacterium]|nr:8-amino-7-oxononanoate synthase [Pseudomonadales bacterium]
MNTWQQQWHQQLAERRAQHRMRELHVLESAPGVNVAVDGKPYLSFISNDYLGLANHPVLKKTLCDAADKFGVGSGASHLLGGHSRAHQQLEEELAAFTGRDRALLFSTGYMANLGVLTALLKKGDCVLEDKLNHASLLDGGLASGADFRRYLHADTSGLQTYLKRGKGRKTLVATDGVFSMDGDLAPLPALAALCKKHDALLMVDDAHGIGVLGKHGAGCCEHFSLSQEDVPVLMGTLGKALGSAGAFVAGSHDMIEMLVQFARTYIYTTAMPPAQAAVTRAALQLLQSESWRREKLQQNIIFFRQQASKHALPLLGSATAIQPIIIGSSDRVMRVDAQLRAAGFLVGAVRPPTVAEGAARLRITLCAEHREADIEKLLETVANILTHTGMPVTA